MERTDHPEKYFGKEGRSKFNEGNSGWATRWHDPPRWEPHRIIYMPTQRNEAQFCMLNLRATVADGQPHAHLQGQCTTSQDVRAALAWARRKRTGADAISIAMPSSASRRIRAEPGRC